MSPKQVRSATFGTSRKGFDPAEVTTFLGQAAEALEAAQNHATAMEARARAAVARLQELTPSGSGSGDRVAESSIDQSQTETISRTLLLAQRAADEAVAEAKVEAQRLLEVAREQAASAGAGEREKARSEVEALRARREFLQSDVDQLERFLEDQRERLRSSAASLVTIAEQVPDGLGHLRPPLLSASDDIEPSDAAEPRTGAGTTGTGTGDGGGGGTDADAAGDTGSGDTESGDAGSGEVDPDDTDAGAATQALPVIVMSDEADRSSDDEDTPATGQIRFGVQPGPGTGDGPDAGSSGPGTADRSGWSPR